MTAEPGAVEASLQAQAASAEHIGSPLYASLLSELLADHRAGGITADLLDGVSAQPTHDAIPLRYLATAHRLALAGDAPGLARLYPSCGGTWRGETLGREFIEVARQHRSAFEAGVRRNVQTNEVGRAPVLATAFALITRRHRMALDLLEIGASAGLLSHWDRYHYDTGFTSAGDPDSPLRFDARWWNDPKPSLSGKTVVASTRCSDIDPIDITTAAGRLTMLSFVWPDQQERLDRLRTALDIAARLPITVERADAGDWLQAQLALAPSTGVATVVFHSIVWQYLPRPTRDGVRRAIHAAADRASEQAPVFWLRMEPAGPTFADVRLTSWPGGGEEVLAEVGYHGTGIRWLAAD
ncbi:unannotated protein [freshwater metagenome]|uniref:Unannotated protein n=1 Tax=freshwater metagenome TaxID=449393 RepID=A0A6J7EZZ6_9ZZZZ|nr:DUF2332 family protein [Actinomycetota bacterium]